MDWLELPCSLVYPLMLLFAGLCLFFTGRFSGGVSVSACFVFSSPFNSTFVGFVSVDVSCGLFRALSAASWLICVHVSLLLSYA